MTLDELRRQYELAGDEMRQAAANAVEVCSRYPDIATAAKEFFGQANVSEPAYERYMQCVSLSAETLEAHLAYEAALSKRIAFSQFVWRRESEEGKRK